MSFFRNIKLYSFIMSYFLVHTRPKRKCKVGELQRWKGINWGVEKLFNFRRYIFFQGRLMHRGIIQIFHFRAKE